MAEGTPVAREAAVRAEGIVYGTMGKATAEPTGDGREGRHEGPAGEHRAAGKAQGRHVLGQLAARESALAGGARDRSREREARACQAGTQR